MLKRFLIVSLGVFLFQQTAYADSTNRWRFSAGINYIYNRNSGYHNADMAIMPSFSMDLGLTKHFGYDVRASESQFSYRLAISGFANKHEWPGLGSFYKYGIYFAPYLTVPLVTFRSTINLLAFNWYPGIHFVYTFHNANDLPVDFFPDNKLQAKIAGGFGFEYNIQLKNKNYMRVAAAQSIMQLFPKQIEGIYAPFSLQFCYVISLKKPE